MGVNTKFTTWHSPGPSFLIGGGGVLSPLFKSEPFSFSTCENCYIKIIISRINLLICVITQRCITFSIIFHMRILYSCVYVFLAHLSWKLKGAFRPSSVCLSVCKLFTFLTSSPEPLGQFQPNLAQSIPGFKFVQVKDHALLKGEIIGK